MNSLYYLHPQHEPSCFREREKKKKVEWVVLVSISQWVVMQNWAWKCLAWVLLFLVKLVCAKSQQELLALQYLETLYGVLHLWVVNEGHSMDFTWTNNIPFGEDSQIDSCSKLFEPFVLHVLWNAVKLMGAEALVKWWWSWKIL